MDAHDASDCCIEEREHLIVGAFDETNLEYMIIFP